jgi:hypothetical protein
MNRVVLSHEWGSFAIIEGKKDGQLRENRKS